MCVRAAQWRRPFVQFKRALAPTAVIAVVSIERVARALTTRVSHTVVICECESFIDAGSLRTNTDGSGRINKTTTTTYHIMASEESDDRPSKRPHTTPGKRGIEQIVDALSEKHAALCAPLKGTKNPPPGLISKLCQDVIRHTPDDTAEAHSARLPDYIRDLANDVSVGDPGYMCVGSKSFARMVGSPWRARHDHTQFLSDTESVLFGVLFGQDTGDARRIRTAITSSVSRFTSLGKRKWTRKHIEDYALALGKHIGEDVYQHWPDNGAVVTLCVRVCAGFACAIRFDATEGQDAYILMGSAIVASPTTNETSSVADAGSQTRADEDGHADGTHSEFTAGGRTSGRISEIFEHHGPGESGDAACGAGSSSVVRDTEGGSSGCLA